MFALTLLLLTIVVQLSYVQDTKAMD